MKEINYDKKGNPLPNNPSELARAIIANGGLEIDTPMSLCTDLVFVIWDEESDRGQAFVVESYEDLITGSKKCHRAFIYKPKK